MCTAIVNLRHGIVKQVNLRDASPWQLLKCSNLLMIITFIAVYFHVFTQNLDILPESLYENM